MEASRDLDLSLSLAPPDRDAAFMMIQEIARDSVDRVAERMKLMPEEKLQEICTKLWSMLESSPSSGARHADELLHLQQLVDGRVDFTPAMLQTAHPVQLRVLAAIMAKETFFIGSDWTDADADADLTADYLMGRMCLNCSEAIPDCECNLCATEKGFCANCTCMTKCNKTDPLWLLRCVICNHRIHMSCMRFDGHIVFGEGGAKMLFRCEACQMTSELFKCVTECLSDDALYDVWDNHVLLDEIELVCKIFHMGTHPQERKLFKECSQLLASIKWSSDEDETDCHVQLFLQFLQEMDNKEFKLEALERILLDATAEPIELSYEILENITNGFSQVIGRGGFGVVYKGVFQNNEVAVKKLTQTEQFSNKQFEDELTCLRRVKHGNIVRFLGYCSDTQKVTMEYKGHYVVADDRRRFLCFEYAPKKSLRDYLEADSQGLQWDTRYNLIEGICHGLRYLHMEERITHLDLKPENILIDAYMVPKITDFGLSRRFSGAQSSIITQSLCGTPGYTAPEYWSRGEISFKADIFSLGIIIKEIFCGSIHSSEFDDVMKIYFFTFNLQLKCARIHL